MKGNREGEVGGKWRKERGRGGKRERERGRVREEREKGEWYSDGGGKQ